MSIVHNVEYCTWTVNLIDRTVLWVNSSASKLATNIAIAVKRRRRELRITQEHLADMAGIDRTYASQIERAIANPSLSVLCSLADSLQLELIDLLRQPSN